jgi:hypothetical protein
VPLILERLQSISVEDTDCWEVCNFYGEVGSVCLLSIRRVSFVVY